MRAQLDARQRQQIVDQPRHAPGLRLHDAEEPLARRRVVARRALQRVDEAGERGERRAQLVADIGDEIGAHVLDAADRREIMDGDDDDAGAARPVAAEPQPARRTPPTSAATAIAPRTRCAAACRSGSRRGSPRPARACAARSTPARRGAAPARAREACGLKAMTRPSWSSTITGSGMPETTASSRTNSGGIRDRSAGGRSAARAARFGLAVAQESAQADEPALSRTAVIGRRHCVAPRYAGTTRECPD